MNTPTNERAAQVLEACAEKLSLYFKAHGPEYVGGVEYSDLQGRIINSVAALRADAAALRPSGTGEGEAVAWMSADGERVISAATKENARRDMGASASATAVYSVPLFAHPQPGAGSVGEAITGIADLRDAKWLDPECADAGCCQSGKFKAAGARSLADMLDPAKQADTLRRFVDRFLGWPLPATVCADGIASRPTTEHRTGTNLLTADEAHAMFAHVLSAAPAAAEPAEGDVLRALSAYVPELGCVSVMDAIANGSTAAAAIVRAIFRAATPAEPAPGDRLTNVAQAKIAVLTEQGLTPVRVEVFMRHADGRQAVVDSFGRVVWTDTTPHPPESPSQSGPACVYGYCPKCGAQGASRERRPNGNDRCTNGCTYPSRDAVNDSLAKRATPSQSVSGLVGTREVVGAFLHWKGIPVEVTGTVKTHPENWPIIDGEGA